MAHSYLTLIAAAMGGTSLLTAADLHVGGIYFDYLPTGGVAVSAPPAGARYEGNVTIPDVVTGDDGSEHEVTAIAAFAFADSPTLTQIHLPEGLTVIGERAFSSCTSLKQLVLPAHMEAVEERAFSGCSGIEEIVFECADARLGEGAFENAASLPWLYLTGVSEVGKEAFAHCTSLQWIEIENGVEVIGAGAFTGCSSLASIYAHAEWPPMITVNTFDSSTEATAELLVVKGARERYAMAAFWNRFLHISETPEFPLTAEGVEQDSVRISTAGSSIIVEGCEETVVLVTPDGKMTAYPANPEKTMISVVSGLYIVKAGSVVKRVMI